MFWVAIFVKFDVVGSHLRLGYNDKWKMMEYKLFSKTGKTTKVIPIPNTRNILFIPI